MTLSRVCLVKPLIKHFGGQAFGVVCAVCACNVLSKLLINLLLAWWSVDTMKRHGFQTRYSEIIWSALQVGGGATFSVHRPHIKVGIR